MEASLIGACALAGFLIGGLGRILIGFLPRGAVVRPGPMEGVGLVLLAVSALLVNHRADLALAMWVVALAIPLATVDLLHRRLPDAITLPALPLTLLLLWGLQAADPAAGSLSRAVLAAVVVAAAFLALWRWMPAAMGLGDAKLSSTIGALLGFHSTTAVIVGLLLAFVLGALAGIVGLVTKRLTLRSAVPFGPFLLAAVWLVTVVEPLQTLS